MVALDVDALAARVLSLGSPGGRVIVGLAGGPGAGKSTVAAALAAALGVASAVIPLDGFHLTSGSIAGTELAARRGAPDTFDAAAFVALLRDLRSDPPGAVLAPEFSRVIEDPIPDAIRVEPSTRIVVTEGNYLLLDTEPWRQIRSLLDACWYLEPDDELRRERLVARHIESGKEPGHAYAWTHGPDEANARLIRASRERADLIVRGS